MDPGRGLCIWALPAPDRPSPSLSGWVGRGAPWRRDAPGPVPEPIEHWWLCPPPNWKPYPVAALCLLHHFCSDHTDSVLASVLGVLLFHPHPSALEHGFLPSYCFFIVSDFLPPPLLSLRVPEHVPRPDYPSHLVASCAASRCDLLVWSGRVVLHVSLLPGPLVAARCVLGAVCGVLACVLRARHHHSKYGCRNPTDSIDRYRLFHAT